MVYTYFERGVGSSWETDVLGAAALNILIALVLTVAPWHVLGRRRAAVATGVGLALGASAAVLATGGSNGLLNLSIPIAALLAAVIFPWRHALAIMGALAGCYLFGTFLHEDASSFRSWYEMAESILISAAVLVGTIGMKYFLMGNADVLQEQKQELDARVRELTAVSSLARSVGAAADRDAMLRGGLDLALNATVCDAGILCLRTEEGSLEPYHTVGISKAAGTVLCRRISLDARLGAAGWAACTSEPIVVPDLGRWLHGREVVGAELEPVAVEGSLTAVPMALGGKAIGVLAVIDSRGLLPPERGMRVLETVAAELAMAVDRQQRIDEGERQRRYLEVLGGIARLVTASLDVGEILRFAVGQTAALVDADVVFLATRQGVKGPLRIVAQHGGVTDGLVGLEIQKGQGIGGKVMAERTTFQTEDYGADPRLEHPFGDINHAEGLRTIIGLPLIHHNREVGVFYAARRVVRLFDASETAILETLSSQVAVALENARLYEDARHKSMHDPLTGLFNRRVFDRRLQEEERRAARHRRPLSLLMIDVDDFKLINDVYGHAEADELLKSLAETAAAAVRKIDLLARYGGEEFVVLLPDTDLAEAVLSAERVRKALRDRFALEDGGRRTVTVSIGVAAFGDGRPGGPSLLERADAAMYHAKRLGKDRVAADGAETHTLASSHGSRAIAG